MTDCAVLVTLLAGPRRPRRRFHQQRFVRLERCEGNLRQSAELIPEADLGFKPTSRFVRSADPGARCRRQLRVLFAARRRRAHSAKALREDGEDQARSQSGERFNRLCDAAFKALTDKSAAESIAMPFGMGNRPRVSALVGNTGHVQEHYGNLVTYFRIKGMVPPSSRR